MKNANGEGSVYKLKGKRRKPWIVVVTTGYKKGRQIRKVLGTFITKREAQTELIAYLDNPMLFSGKTFKDVRELWFNTYSKKVSKNRLYNVEKESQKLYCLDELKIKEIKLPILQNLFDSLDKSYGTKKNLKTILNMIFEYALKNDYVDANKTRFIELGKSEKVVERKIFTKEEIDILFQNVDSNKKYINLSYVVLILIYTGLRISELFNLKVEDIDLINNTLQIKESKTFSGVRTIPIPNKVISLFKNNINPAGVYFLQGSKKEQEYYASFLFKFNKLMKLLNLESHTIHDTRHTFATMLNNANANETSIIKLIGHSDFTTTQNVYTHKDVEELRKAVDLLN